MKTEISNDVVLIYDQECPACHLYCQTIRIDQGNGPLARVNARESSEVLNQITAAGMDIDQGMVLKVGEQLYYGSDAIHALALMSSRQGVINRLNYWMFKSKRVSRVLYPCLRFFRNILLKLLGKTKINNLKVSGNDRF